MRFPWQKRFDAAQAETQKARTEYEWAVQNRTTVRDVVAKLVTHGSENGLIEKLNLVARGGHK